MTYVSSFYHAFSGAQKVPGRASRPAALLLPAAINASPLLTSFLLQMAVAWLGLEATPPRLQAPQPTQS